MKKYILSALLLVAGAAMSGLGAQTTTYTVKGVSFKMVAVPAGTFMMGASKAEDPEAYATSKEGPTREAPVHQVTLSAYSIGQTTVTQELWQAVMGTNPAKFKGAGRPVENVSWNECQTFVKRLSSLTGKKFRLPTEAEWEYAARGADKSNGTHYAGSDDIEAVAWYFDNCEDTSRPRPVAQKQPNELGLYDMSGNLWEWCSDWYGDYTTAALTNPTGAAFSSNSNKVMRGGSWRNPYRSCRVTTREICTPDIKANHIGLRLVLQ
ncbi:MAG: SUMF1/EgtB/PvdO family nonheme iron enzyme [Alloprevotella sp.]|nr:SUMF1/EgtB/PvdO family nonheme iron enzyme [Alloprevotella sp.]